MTILKSRNSRPNWEKIARGAAEEYAQELDLLVDKIDDFLEIRIKEEFAELKADILEVSTLNQALMEDSLVRQKHYDALLEMANEMIKAQHNQITALTASGTVSGVDSRLHAMDGLCPSIRFTGTMNG